MSKEDREDTNGTFNILNYRIKDGKYKKEEMLSFTKEFKIVKHIKYKYKNDGKDIEEIDLLKNNDEEAIE